MTKPSRQLPTSDEAVIREKRPRRPLHRPPVQSHYGFMPGARSILLGERDGRVREPEVDTAH
jgi:hypothetical protein